MHSSCEDQRKYYEKETEYKKKRNRVEKEREEATECSVSFSFIIWNMCRKALDIGGWKQRML